MCCSCFSFRGLWQQAETETLFQQCEQSVDTVCQIIRGRRSSSSVHTAPALDLFFERLAQLVQTHHLQPSEASRISVANAFDMLDIIRDRIPSEESKGREYAFAKQTFARTLSDDLCELSREHGARTCVAIMRQRPAYDLLHLYCNLTRIRADSSSFLDVMVQALDRSPAAGVRVVDSSDPAVQRFVRYSRKQGFDMTRAWEACSAASEGGDFAFAHAMVLHTPVNLLSTLLPGAIALLEHRVSVLRERVSDFAFVAMVHELRARDWAGLDALLEAVHRGGEMLAIVTDFRDARERWKANTNQKS